MILDMKSGGAVIGTGIMIFLISLLMIWSISSYAEEVTVQAARLNVVTPDGTKSNCLIKQYAVQHYWTGEEWTKRAVIQCITAFDITPPESVGPKRESN